MNTRQRRRAAATIVTALLVAGAVAVVAAAAPGRKSAAPSNTAKPTLEGKFQAGQTISTTNGTWTNNPTQFTYQWERCNAAGTGCANIAGATSKTYKLTSSEVDRTVDVEVTASNSDGKNTVSSNMSPVISDSSAPRNTARPAISGTPEVGDELKVSNGTWTGGVSSYSYQWKRCDEKGDSCANVVGATAATYGVRSADKGRTMRAEVTAKNAAGETTVNTDRSAVIKAAATAPPPPPSPVGKCVAGATTVAVTDVNLPQRLLIDKFTFNPSVVTRFTQTLTGRIHISDTCGRSVSGAQLWGTAIPYNQTNVAQGATGTDGWGTLNFQMLFGFPANPGRQQILAMLLRATKPKDSILAGVSTRLVARVNVNLKG
jgi:hypothetical protein